jgi:hypothetical protein
MIYVSDLSGEYFNSSKNAERVPVRMKEVDEVDQSMLGQNAENREPAGRAGGLDKEVPHASDLENDRPRSCFGASSTCLFILCKTDACSHSRHHTILLQTLSTFL